MWNRVMRHLARPYRLVTLVALVALLMGCGVSVNRSAPGIAEFVGMKGSRACFVPETSSKILRGARTGCFKMVDGSDLDALRSGDCVTVELTDIAKFPNQKEHLLGKLDRPCDLNRKFVERVTKALMDRKSQTGFDNNRTEHDVNPSSELGEV
jgi:hypothetical protein